MTDSCLWRGDGMPAVKIFGVVVDKRTLSKFTTMVGGGATSIVATLLSVGHVAQLADESGRNLNVSTSCDCA